MHLALRFHEFKNMSCFTKNPTQPIPPQQKFVVFASGAACSTGYGDPITTSVRHHVSTHGRVHGPGEKNMTNRFLHIYSIYIIIILHHSSLALFVGWFQGDRGGHPKFAIGFWHLQEAKFHIGVRSSVVATPSIKIRQVSQTRSSRLHHVAFY